MNANMNTSRIRAKKLVNGSEKVLREFYWGSFHDGCKKWDVKKMNVAMKGTKSIKNRF